MCAVPHTGDDAAVVIVAGEICEEQSDRWGQMPSESCDAVQVHKVIM